MSRTASALTEEAVLPTLHNQILAEVYLAGGPVNLYRLWSEMFERQKTITVGTLLFGKAFFELEDGGFLQKVSEMKSGLTGKGEMYLMALLLAGNLSDEALVRLAEGGITLASTGNILDVAPQQEQPTKAVNHESGTGEVRLKTGEGCARKPLTNTNCDTNPIRHNSHSDGGEAATASPLYFLASEIVDIVELAEQYRAEEEAAAEEGALIDASNYQRPEYERNGR